MPGRRSARGHVAAPARRSAGLNPHDPLDVVYQGYTVLVCRHDGSIEGAGREGLWDFDTRILSRHR
ncbi:MAG: glycogen debranching N-terminal domain-containing protein, partial [Gemmatimonadota bacterium]